MPSNLLASLYSGLDSAKRHAGNFLSDPQEVTRQYFQNANQDAGESLNMLSALYRDQDGRPTLDPAQWAPAAKTAHNALANEALGAMAGTTGPGRLTPFDQIQAYSQNGLGRYTPRVYRQADLIAADSHVPGSQTFSGSQADRLFFANHPEYALGQGGNAGGALMEFEAAGIPGNLSMTKPGARNMYDQGYAEFLSGPVAAGDIAQNLRSMKFDAADLKSAHGRRLESTLARAGFVKQIQDDGKVVFQKP